MVMFDILKRDAVVTDNAYGNFTPNQSAAYVLASAFCWASVITLCKLVRYRKETVNPVGVYFLFLGTPILSCVGYAVRVPSLLNVWSNPLYLANMILIALAPIYLVTVTWIIFAALVQYAGPQYSALRPHAILVAVFLLLVATLQLEIRGLVYAYDHSSGAQTVGAGLMLGGLGLQLVVGLIFFSLFVTFARRYFREHSRESQARMRELCTAILVNNILFIIRTIYRIVEFSLLARNNSDQIGEVYLYVFDALPTFVGVMTYTFSLPYELPYRQAFLKGKRCGTTAACNDGARGPWAEEVVVDEVSSIDKAPIA